MKHLLKLRQVLFCALFLCGLCKTNIVKVLYVKKFILCKTDIDIHAYMYMHIYIYIISVMQMLAGKC